MPSGDPDMESVQRVAIRFEVNGYAYEAEVEPWRTLAELLRDGLAPGFKSVKQWCEEGECGSCTVLVDDAPVASCLYPAARAHGRSIRTVESLSPEGELHPLQDAFITHDAIQCGFCTPGMLMSAVALLEATPDPTRDEIRAAIAGNLCRCSGYEQIEDAIESAAKTVQSDRAGLRDGGGETVVRASDRGRILG